ncbi:procathepsin L-like isoform X1 [Haliotis rufescens]|uniref:procathepsin L-like isoform X1 n=2 Tax=Haliotis rufescens TaxID=6454 RepID=UPI001EB086E6|nr:procathepsin L-like isoform X1 [Haliotis rufescens]
MITFFAAGECQDFKISAIQTTKMQYTVMIMCAFAATVAAMPQYVEWFEMKPAMTVSEARLSFAPYTEEWDSFKKQHNRNYEEVEEPARFEIFKQNLKYIEQHNQKYSQGQKSYYLGINQFADMKNKEFRMYNGLRRDYNRSRAVECSKHLTPEYLAVPSQVDWRDKGYVTPVKNQGQCGSCWSFSTTGSLEGQHYRASHKLVSLSEQQLVDCSGKFGNEGCNGGLMDQAFEYVITNGGIESENEYPYDAKQERCHFKKSEIAATASGCVDVESGSESDLKSSVAEVGPVSIAIDASHQSFQLYSGGVYDEPECSSTELDHGVLVAGYGTDDGKDYWLVKNSWGTTWGVEGYVKMSRNQNNQCGVATQASYPLV